MIKRIIQLLEIDLQTKERVRIWKNSFITPRKKKLLVALITLVLVLQPFSFIPQVKAWGSMEFTKDAKNVTQGQTTYLKSVSANQDDIIRFRLYYRNNLSGTTLTNLILKDILPSTSGTTLTNTATAKTDQTSLQTDSAQVNTSTNLYLSYVTGSTKWFGHNDSVGTSIPDVNSTSPLLTAQGYNINQVLPGFENEAWIRFDVKVTSTPPTQPTPQITFKKDVKNITTSSGYSDNVNASVGNTIRFRLYAHNSVVGSTAHNVVLKDNLPTSAYTYVINTATLKSDETSLQTDTASVTLPTALVLDYIPNSTRIFGHNDPVGTPIPDVSGTSPLLTSSGYTLSELIGCWEYEKWITFDVKVPELVVKIEKSKSAYNETQYVDATTVKAKSNDVIKYTLVTKNTGNGTAYNYVIEDGIADILEYADVTYISDGGYLVNNPGAPDDKDKTLVRWPQTNIGPSVTVTRIFKVKVKNPIPTNPQVDSHFDLKMENFYGNWVTVEIELPPAHVITISIGSSYNCNSNNTATFRFSALVYNSDFDYTTVKWTAAGQTYYGSQIYVILSPGTYTITATATDAAGHSATTSVVVKVSGVMYSGD